MRLARDQDGRRVAALIERVFAEYEGCIFETMEFPELRRPATHYAMKGGAMFVAEQGEEIVGSIAWFHNRAPDVFELGKVYVDESLRGAGLAARLLDVAMTDIRARGGREIVLFSDTRFTRGHAFYEKHGFQRLPGLRLLEDVSNTLEYGFRLNLEGAAA
ncbi:MAG: GNAT family N-acetyltransferase [Beijerinckiaceae bacterium]